MRFSWNDHSLLLAQFTRNTCAKLFVRKNRYRTIYEHDTGVPKASLSRGAGGKSGSSKMGLYPKSTHSTPKLMVSDGSRCVNLDANDVKAAELLTLIRRGMGGGGGGAISSRLESGKRTEKRSGTGKKKEETPAKPRKQRRLAEPEA